MHEWIITTDIGRYSDGGPLLERVHAEYMKPDISGDFIEFKDSDHKTVYMAASRHVVSVSRVGSNA